MSKGVYLVYSENVATSFWTIGRHARGNDKKREIVQPTYLLCDIKTGELISATHIVKDPAEVHAGDKKVYGPFDPQTLAYFEKPEGRLSGSDIAAAISKLPNDQKELVETAYHIQYGEPLPAPRTVARDAGRKHAHG